jgi:hypothetical protein
MATGPASLTLGFWVKGGKPKPNPTSSHNLTGSGRRLIALPRVKHGSQVLTADCTAKSNIIHNRRDHWGLTVHDRPVAHLYCRPSKSDNRTGDASTIALLQACQHVWGYTKMQLPTTRQWIHYHWHTPSRNKL